MKAQAYVDWLKTQAALKRPYWYGTCGYECTESLLTRKRKQYPAHYGSSRTARYRRDIAANQICGDCVGGAIKWAVWSNLGTQKNVYQSGGCPDASADGMFRYCKKQGMAWGSMDSMPDLPGIAVRSSGHVGVYVGDGQVVEWRGFAYGCVTTDVKKRPWTHWYRMPWVEYDAAGDAGDEAPIASLLGSRLLKKGRRGEDVRELQTILNELGFNAGDADGIYGQQTEAAVKRMQQAAQISVDGDYGEQSHAALMGMVADADPDTDPPEVQPKQLQVTGGRVNIRSGPGTQYRILTIVRRGTQLAYTAQADNGWYAVQIGGENGWISGKYAQPMDA